ncbi:hypothetical protein BO443_10876 [Burkholderia orbicola]
MKAAYRAADRSACDFPLVLLEDENGFDVNTGIQAGLGRLTAPGAMSREARGRAANVFAREVSARLPRGGCVTLTP